MNSPTTPGQNKSGMNAASVVAAGVEILVAGHAIFNGEDVETATRELKAAALEGLTTGLTEKN